MQAPKKPRTPKADKPNTTANGEAEEGAEPAADGKKQRKPRKKKDPNAPKKSLAAFMFFSNANRERIKTNNPGVPFGQVWVEETGSGCSANLRLCLPGKICGSPVMPVLWCCHLNLSMVDSWLSSCSQCFLCWLAAEWNSNVMHVGRLCAYRVLPAHAYNSNVDGMDTMDVHPLGTAQE